MSRHDIKVVRLEDIESKNQKRDATKTKGLEQASNLQVPDKACKATHLSPASGAARQGIRIIMSGKKDCSAVPAKGRAPAGLQTNLWRSCHADNTQV